MKTSARTPDPRAVSRPDRQSQGPTPAAQLQSSPRGGVRRDRPANQRDLVTGRARLTVDIQESPRQRAQAALRRSLFAPVKLTGERRVGSPVRSGIETSRRGDIVQRQPFELDKLPSNVVAQIIDLLPVKDVGSASRVSKGWRGKFQQVGRGFMNALYRQPSERIPRLLPSVRDWAEGRGRPADPKLASPLVYKMAGLDPLTRLQVALGSQSKSAAAGKHFLTGQGGFIAHELEPAETDQDADLKHQTALKNYRERKERGEKVGPTEPVRKPPKPPTPTDRLIEYHPGGGVHSNYAQVPPTEAMGGSYFKVEDPATKGDNYRFARYGPFKSGKVPGHFWDPLKPSPEQDADPELVNLSAEALATLGARAEREGNTELAGRCLQEAQRRLRRQNQEDKL